MRVGRDHLRYRQPLSYLHDLGMYYNISHRNPSHGTADGRQILSLGVAEVSTTRIL